MANKKNDLNIDEEIRSGEAAIYARFSSYNQSVKSIEDQITDCKEFAASYNLIVRDFNIFTDEARTATDDNRPGLQNLLTIAKTTRRFKYIIVWKLDRLSRNLKDSINITDELKKYDIHILSFSERTPIDSKNNISYQFSESIQMVLNDYFSKELAQKTKRGMYRQAQKNGRTGAAIPFGFQKSTDENKIYSINETEAEAVRKIFKMYLEGSTAEEISKYLYSNGFKSHKKDNSKIGDSAISKSGVYNILRNKKYIGVFEFNMEYENEGKVTTVDKSLQIISDEVFEQVQEKLASKPKKGNCANYILSGKIFCAKCGGKVTGRKGKDKYYYSCSNKYNKENKCTLTNMKKEVLEQAITNAILEKLLKPAFLNKIDKEIEKLAKNNDSEKAKLKLTKELNELNSKYGKLRETFVQLSTSDDELDKSLASDIRIDINNILVKIKNIENQIKEIDEQKKSLEVISIEDYKRYIDKILNNYNEDAIQLLVNNLVDYISVDDNYTILISLKTLKKKQSIPSESEKSVFFDYKTKKKIAEYVEEDEDEDENGQNDNDDDNNNTNSGNGSVNFSGQTKCDMGNSGNQNNEKSNENSIISRIKKMTKNIGKWPNILRQMWMSLYSVSIGEPDESLYKPQGQKALNDVDYAFYVSTSGDCGLIVFLNIEDEKRKNIR